MYANQLKYLDSGFCSLTEAILKDRSLVIAVGCIGWKLILVVK